MVIGTIPPCLEWLEGPVGPARRGWLGKGGRDRGLGRATGLGSGAGRAGGAEVSEDLRRHRRGPTTGSRPRPIPGPATTAQLPPESWA